MSDHQAWLEQPYQEAEAYGDFFETVREDLISDADFEPCFDGLCAAQNPCPDCVQAEIEWRADDVPDRFTEPDLDGPYEDWREP